MRVPCTKLLTLTLIFIVSVHSGYCVSFLSDLRDAVIGAESWIRDGIQYIATFAKHFKTAQDVFDAAVEEHCVFKCPVQGVTPKPNHNYVPRSDGCGSLGLQIKSEYLPIAEMKKCCDGHDICYDTCNRDKEVCDTKFKRCLYKFCDKYGTAVGENIVKACKGAAKMLYTGTLTLGCKSYLDSQKRACYCPSYGWKDSRNSRHTRGDGEL